MAEWIKSQIQKCSSRGLPAAMSGIVIDAWVRISLVGIDLITVEARVVVASIDTYLKYADAVGLTGLVARPQLEPEEEEEIVTVETTRRTATRPAGRRRMRAAAR